MRNLLLVANARSNRKFELRICYIAPAIEIPGKDGGSVHVYEVVSELAKRGVEVSLIARKTRELSTPNLRVIDVSSRFVCLKYTKTFLRVLQEARGSDLIYERTDFFGIGAIASFLTGKPLVMETISAIIDERAPRLLRGILSFWLNMRYKRARKIITPIDTLIPEQFRAKTFTLECGADVEKFARVSQAEADVLKRKLKLEGKKIVLFSGACGEWHGIYDLFSALELLRAKRKDIELLLIGKNNIAPIIKRAQKIGGIHILGPQPSEDVPKFLKLADVLAAPFNPSYFPPLLKYGFYWSPLKVFEYMASGKPIVTTTPLERVIEHQKHALIVKPGNIQALADAIEFLADNPEEAALLAKNAQEKVASEFTWKKHVDKLEKVLKEAAGKMN
ncbi:MAG: glycosyltransferase family 4 protein [Candidatus Micrarchaeota archaeon]